MRKLLLLCVALCAVIAGCNSAKTENGAPQNNPAATCCQSPPGQPNYMDSVAMLNDTASPMILRYRDSAMRWQPDGQDKMKRRTSFDLDARAIRQYLNAQPDISKLHVYLMMTDSGISAVSVGAKVDPVTHDTVDVFYQKNVLGVDRPCVFDMTLPCPVCETSPLGVPTAKNKK